MSHKERHDDEPENRTQPVGERLVFLQTPGGAPQCQRDKTDHIRQQETSLSEGFEKTRLRKTAKLYFPRPDRPATATSRLRRR